MADEISGAYERLLAFLPEETRAMLGGAKHILGTTQLVAENAKRCGVEVSGPGWDGGLGDDCWDERWTVCGVSFTIEWPYSNYYRSWTARRNWAEPGIEAPTFSGLFDKIVAAALEIQAEETVEVDGDAGSEWTPNFWRCGPPLFKGVPPCGGMPLG